MFTRLVRRIVLVAAALAMGALPAHAATATKRFVVAATLLVDGKPLDGAAVWEMQSRAVSGSFGNGLPYQLLAKGEAIAFPLSDELVVFVLKRARNFVSSRAYGAFLAECGAVMPPAVEAFEGSCDIEDLPEIVVARGAVGGPELPELTRVVDGAAGDLGIELGRLSIQVTDEPRTSGLITRYPWIGMLPSGVRGSHSASELYQIDFVAD